jgi:RHS repeat-associated protein
LKGVAVIAKDLGLNWMDFHNRQYDPQLGMFLSIDPLAAVTANVSPYAAMDNNPVSNVDPLGLQDAANLLLWPVPRSLQLWQCLVLLEIGL